MYETDERGTMLWNALDPEEKRLAKIAFWTSIPPGALLLVPIGREGYAFGQWLRWEREAADSRLKFMDALASSPWFVGFVVVAIACALICALAWWRFGQRQDELFHRIQNHALGRTAAVGVILVFLFWALSLTGWVTHFPLEAAVVIEIMVFSVFSGDAYRRWG
jgi:hypothetical protein